MSDLEKDPIGRPSTGRRSSSSIEMRGCKDGGEGRAGEANPLHPPTTTTSSSSGGGGRQGGEDAESKRSFAEEASHLFTVNCPDQESQPQDIGACSCNCRYMYVRH